MKYLGVSLIKYIQDLYAEDHETVKIKDLSKCKDIVSWKNKDIRSDNSAQMFFLCIAIPINIPAELFCKYRQIVFFFNIHGNHRSKNIDKR